MINQVMGIKKFQTNLPKVARQIRDVGGHILVTNRNEPALVAISFEDYQILEDVLAELNSPQLQKDVAEGRREYMKEKTKLLNELMEY